MLIDAIGWADNGNLGDDACLQAVRRLLHPHVVEQGKHTGQRPCVLSGGTLIYGDDFLQPAQAAAEAGQPMAVLGSGVDLAVPLSEWEPERRRSWERVLRHAGAVGVRGPRSLEAVRQLGRDDAQVIGDPALLLGKARPAVSGNRDRDLVAINLGSDFDPPCGHLGLVSEAIDLVGWFQKLGLRVEYFAMRNNEFDDRRAGRLIAQTGIPTHRPHLGTVLDLIRRANFVVSLRLHGAVLAAACGVPFVSLGYRAKHRDFCESMGVGELLVDLDDGFHWSDARRVIERIDAKYADYVRRLAVAGDDLRGAARRMATRWRDGLEGGDG
jgi:polysaccharide pyruvyl transferase WcaK-like protein